MTVREKLQQLMQSEERNQAIIDAFVLGCMAGIKTAGEKLADAIIDEMTDEELDALMDAGIEVEEVED